MAGCLYGKPLTAGVWISCSGLSSVIGAGAFISGVMYDVFWGPSPTSAACNSNDHARTMMNALCGTKFPQVRY
jgi:hypothetical protein